MKRVLVTGANGQLGKCIQDAALLEKDISFVFASKSQVSVADKESIAAMFNNNTFDYCINAAAYTNVEKAESEPEQAFAVNAEGAKYLADACNAHDTVLIQLSTDYVFDGKKNKPYVETDTTQPLNVYGASKLKGELNVIEKCAKHYVVRTSWLYSQYGHNFLNTILKHAKMGNPLSITTEQKGTPTNANDLAGVLLEIVRGTDIPFGVYHFSNGGEATWYDFAKEILTQHPQLTDSKLGKTDHYPTFAKRPMYSVLNTNKIERLLKIGIEPWEESLKSVLIKF